jgi:hypothetical protein
METWVIFLATIVAIIVIGSLIKERIADKKSQKQAQNKLAEEPQPAAAVVTDSTEQATLTTNRTGTEILTDFLTQMGCTVGHSEVREEWTYRVFLCQGAYFESYTHNENDEILLYYHWTIPYSKENTIWVQRICHQLTSKEKYGKVTYRYESENDRFDIIIQCGAINPSMEILKYLIYTIFEIARELQSEYQDRNKKSVEEQIEDARERELFYRCLQYKRLPKLRTYANRFLNANKLVLSDVIGILFGAENVEDLLSLTIVSENGVEQIIQRDKIAALDLFSLLIHKKDNTISVFSTPISLMLDTTFYHYTFTLHLVDQMNSNVFIRLTAVKVPYDHLQKLVPEKVYIPDTISCVICYEENEEHSFKMFNKNINEADQAKKEGKTLTDEQEDLLRISGIGLDYDGKKKRIDYQVQEGVRLANHSYYVQAITLLEPAFRALCERYHPISRTCGLKAVNVAHHLGRCYYDLKQYDKAFYYISFVRNSGRIDGHYTYFKFLYETRDIRLNSELSIELEKVESEMQHLLTSEGLEEYGQENFKMKEEYYLFLLKMHAKIKIRFCSISEAYRDLNILLQYDQTHDFAQENIDYLNKRFKG